MDNDNFLLIIVNNKLKVTDMALMAKIWTWATLVGGEWPTTATHALPVGFSVFRFFIFFYKFNCTDPGLQLGDPAPLFVLLLWTCWHFILILICLYFTVTSRQRTFPGVWAFQANPYRLGRLSQKRISVGKFEEEGRSRAGRDTSILLSGWISFCWTQNLSIVNQASFGH